MKTITPFGLMRRLSDDMERMFEDLSINRPFSLTRPLGLKFDWLPAIEVAEKDQTLVVRAELPGMTKDDVKIDVNDRLLTLQGERRQERQEKKEDYFLTERAYGTFYRQIALPEGAKTDEVAATFKNGLLEVRVPLAVKTAVGTRQVPIEGVKELVGA